MYKKLLHTLLFILVSIGAFAQATFSDQTSRLNFTEVNSGAPIAVSDLNGDFLDDIIRLDNTSDLIIDYQNEDGSFTPYSMMNASPFAWAICVADITNDGMCEIIAGGAYDNEGVTILNPNGDGTFSRSNLDGPAIFVQGTNFADANNDGFIDAFICHDDGPSVIWSNDGQGNITYDDNQIIDFRLYGGGEQDSGNYGSVWTDFDSDGDLDLYIAKCRQGVNNPEDTRRINQLWINDGNNNYTEAAANHGLAIGWQSWTAEFQDIDNDGDFDCFITNHDFQSQLFENVNNQFIDITESSGIDVNGLPVQAAMKDFDNDGFVDLLVTGNYFHNNGDKTFTKIFPNPVEDIHSFALGDMNHDGFIDVYAGYGSGFNSTGGSADKLWFNETNNNNWLAVNLIGQQSNIGGIGAKLELRGDWGVMVREVRAGESYGIVNTLTQHFGIGAANEIETLTVNWPSGTVDVIENPDINQFITLIENNCIALDAPLMISGETILCPGESVEISAPMGYDYTWSNGANSQSIVITEPGNYAVTIADQVGCFGVSQTVNVIFDPEESLSIDVQGELTFCEGGSVELTAIGGQNPVWSDGQTGQTISVTESGNMAFSADGTCNIITSSNVIVDVLPAADAPEASDVFFTEPSTVTLTATGNNLRWYDVPDGGEPIGEGNEFETPIISETTPYYVEDANIYGGGSASIGPEDHTGSSEFSGNQFNGELIFNAYESFVLKSVKVYTDLPGLRVIELQDINGTVLESAPIMLEEGESTVPLEMNIPQGENLVLTTNTPMNIDNFGFESPRLRRTSTNSDGVVEYPYVIDDVVEIFDSNFGDDWYYYFFDWKLELESTKCFGPRTEVSAVFDEANSAYSIEENDAIHVFPNPTQSYINIEISKGSNYDFRLMDMTGRVLLHNNLNANAGTILEKVEVKDFAKGMYWLQFMDAENVYTAKILVQ